MLFSKKINLFTLIIVVLTLISMPNICASDFENATVENNHVTATENLSICENSIGTFDELNNDIANLSPGDVYTIDKDYIFEHDGQSNGPKLVFGDHGIDISVNDVTINGNGHCIDGNHKTNLFKVTGNNVKIFNLTFVNSKYTGCQIPISSKNGNANGVSQLIVKLTDDMSPICWIGDNGLISDCVFSHNTALNGGAIKWSGNNGFINNSLFINNIASGVGGAIYVSGTNDSVANLFIINSTSQLTREAIYLDRKSENFTFSNCMADNSVFLIEGNFTGIDVDNYLRYTYYSQVGDKRVNLVPIMYRAIMLGFVGIDDDLSSYVQYANDTGDLTFTLIRNFAEFGIEYQKNYLFKKTTLNDAFEFLIKDNYKNSVVMAKTINVTDKKGYESLCHGFAETYIADNRAFVDLIYPDLMEMSTDTSKFCYSGCVSYALNVFYAPGSVFKSNAQWNKNNNFAVVNIFGNGAKIVASSGDRDENKWIETASNQVYMIYNLTVEGFNTAIDNREGYCVLNNVALNHNRMDYIMDRDDGAAILNGAVVICNNCSFANNYAKNGGAIFSQGLLVLDNCTFKANKGYGTGDNVLNVDQGIVLLNGQNIKESKGPVTYVKSISSFVSAFITTLTTIGTIIAGVGSGIAATVASGGNFAVGIGVGVAIGTVVGGVLGVAAAFAIAPYQYNLCFDRINTAERIIYSCVLTGAFSGFIGGAIMGAYYALKSGNTAEMPFEENINGETSTAVEDIPLGDKFEKDYSFWGPLKSEVKPPAQTELPIENPEVPVENPTTSGGGYIKIKDFDKISFESRAKIANAVNSGKCFSIDFDCYDCTCKVFDDLGEINEINFVKGFSEFSPCSLIVKYTAPDGEQMQLIFGFKYNFEIVPGYPRIEYA